MSHVKGHYRVVDGKLVWVNEHEREGQAAGEKFSLFGEHGIGGKQEEPAPAPKPEPKVAPKVSTPKHTEPKPKSEQEVAATGSDLGSGLDAPETKAELTKEHYTDVGKKIGGAAKDMAALKAKYWKTSLAVTLDDLEAMEGESPELAQQLLTKEQQLGTKAEFISQMKNQGASPGCAYFASRLYAMIGDPVDTPAGRKAFALGILRFQKAAAQWQTVGDVVQGIACMRNEAAGVWLQPGAAEHLEGLKETYTKTRAVLQEMEHYTNDFGGYVFGSDPKPKTEEAQKALEAWKAAESSYKEKKKELEVAAKADPNNPEMPVKAMGQKFLNSISSYQWIKSTRKRSWEVDGEMGWGFAEKKSQGKDSSSEGGAPKEKQKKPWHGWVKPENDTVEKSGGAAAKIYVAQTLADTFGIKGVEYGNWMDKDASLHHTQACGEALADLAFVLGMDPKEVSLNGRLSIAFGARGKGKAAAHYEPDKKVVNMTKKKGGGSLAHEWGHALDNIMAMVSTGGTSHHLALMMDSKGVPPGDQMPYPVVEAFMGVYEAMHQGDFQKTNTVHIHPEVTPTVSAGSAMLGRLKDNGGDVQKTLEYYETAFAYNKKYHPKKFAKMMKRHAQALANHLKAPVPIISKEGKPTSHFVATGETMGEKYWGSKPELFARAWESFVMDKMTEKGMKNTYLVSGVMKEQAEQYGKMLQVLEPLGGKTSVYPLGEERERINAAFEKLVAALNTHKMFAKAISILNMRSLFD